MKISGSSCNNKSAEDSSSSDEDLSPLRCWECNVNFTSKHYLYNHLIHHIRQPFLVLKRVQLPPLKITFKNRSGNSFEIISSPTGISPQYFSDSDSKTSFNLAETKEGAASSADEQDNSIDKGIDLDQNDCELSNVCFSPTFADVNGLSSPIISEHSSNAELSSPKSENMAVSETENTSDYGSVTGTEPTPPPPPEVPTEYPKIRIKTTGLLKESLTITEITDDNPNGDNNSEHHSNASNNIWSLEDPLKLPDDDNNLLSLFNNNERAKDLGFTTSDSEFISLDRLDDRNRGALQLYNPNNHSATNTSNALETLTGLPMQALAQQVSRLQPGNGMHQQNVLINIQQFPQPPPPQPTYQPPPMYHHPPHPQQMYQPYQYQPPNPYYPQPPGYPPQHMPPPQPPMGQMGQPSMNQQGGQHNMGQPPMNQNQLVPVSQQQQHSQQQHNQQQQQNMSQMPQNAQQAQQYRQPIAPRPPNPRQPGPIQRPPAPRQPMQPRQPMGMRQRAPMMRPRGAGNMTAVRGGVRPRMPGTSQNGQPRPQTSPVKRPPDQQNMQAKKKRFDVLTPDKDDDDCQVICMQPKNTDGGLPQIESVQGGQSEPAENSIMHLSDSITLSVRNPPPKPQSPKKSDAKAVANILATRGITVTATGKPKEKETTSTSSSPLPSSLNLNGAVSIIPSGKNNGNKNASQEPQLQTVDLTDDTDSKSNSPQKQNQRPGLPFRCELCPAQYPNAMGLSKHRQNYHKTSSGMPELGIPVINMKQPGIMQKLSGLGIHNYIPVPSSGPEGTFIIPIINSRNPGNINAIGAQSMITLGPIRTIPKATPPGNNTNNAAKPPANQK